MSNYKDQEGNVYKQGDLEVFAARKGMDFDTYVEKHGLTFDKIDYDDATIGQKFCRFCRRFK